ncbi:hypothetical protein QAD02_014785 [Eretmocerus hayati]|uniref:Uncharacterized protein n=1 Tax=Eretmocerus hayati TaxID=131215 RepID=A0ACC2P690_9HYME|nr:hypothetical protein QAD02_014785 [Eretmocerus hayati]
MIHAAQTARGALALVMAFACYLLFMDYLLYSRTQNYAIRPIKSEKKYEGKIPCDIDPFCVVTVKALMLDYPNLYILSPLAAGMDRILGISSKWSWVTPNIISGFHVLVAALAGCCVASCNLSERRLGVLFFELRTWLDDLDGHVARQRKHINGEHSDIGSAGYWIDGICDALGCIALLVGVFHFLKKNPLRRGYDKLYRIHSCVENQDNNFDAVAKRMRYRVVLCNIFLVVGHLLIVSIGWNRYISLYQDLLEGDSNLPSITKDELYTRQSEVMRSGFFWIVTVAWRLINFHSAVDYLLIAIFIDRLWEYARFIKWFGYILPLMMVYITEFHFLQSYAYVLRGSDLITSAETLQNLTEIFDN